MQARAKHRDSGQEYSVVTGDANLVDDTIKHCEQKTDPKVWGFTRWHGEDLTLPQWEMEKHLRETPQEWTEQPGVPA